MNGERKIPTMTLTARENQPEPMFLRIWLLLNFMKFAVPVPRSQVNRRDQPLRDQSAPDRRRAPYQTFLLAVHAKSPHERSPLRESRPLHCFSLPIPSGDRSRNKKAVSVS